MPGFVLSRQAEPSYWDQVLRLGKYNSKNISIFSYFKYFYYFRRLSEFKSIICIFAQTIIFNQKNWFKNKNILIFRSFLQ